MSTSTSMADPAASRAAGEPRTAFVLAGGAAMGAMQAGMIHALYERGITPDLLIGTSAGALNAAFLASRPATVATAHELAGLWRGLRRRDILPLRPATLLSGLAGRRDHLIPDQALRRLAARHLQFARLEQASIPLHRGQALASCVETTTSLTLRWPIPHHRTPAATNRLTQDPVPILFTGRQAPIRSEDRHVERAPLK